MFHGPRNTASAISRISVVTLAILATVILASGQVNTSHFSAVMLLGSDSILLQPAKQKLNMLLTVESADFDRYVVKGEGRDQHLPESGAHLD